MLYNVLSNYCFIFWKRGRKNTQHKIPHVSYRLLYLVKAAEIAEDGEIAGADVPRVVGERLLQMLMWSCMTGSVLHGRHANKWKIEQKNFCTSFYCLKKSIIIHLSRNVIKDDSGGKIIGREVQQELHLLEFLLGHVTYVSPEEWRNTFPLPSLNFEAMNDIQPLLWKEKK